MKEVIFIVSFVVVSSFSLGWACNELYEYYNYHREVNGFYLYGYEDKATALDIGSQKDKYGDWVCINVRDMTYEEVVETCQHEAGHELFAEIIEDSPEKIPRVMEVLNE